MTPVAPLYTDAEHGRRDMQWRVPASLACLAVCPPPRVTAISAAIGAVEAWFA